jgi:outer membrane protein OmpA-like peptidoglycan-associated protein
MFEDTMRARNVSFALMGAMLAAATPARAQVVSDAQILQALSPAPSAPRTRGLTLGPQTSAPAPASGPAASVDAAFIDSLRDRTELLAFAQGQGAARPGEREKLGTVAAVKPQIDLPMEFDRNSDVLHGQALENANSLGRALSDPSMRGQTFVIAGHTDARGSDALNQKLSERRADALKQFLVRTYGLPAANLITVGYGKTRLKNPNDPEGQENRRVQAVNMLQAKSASR